MSRVLVTGGSGFVGSAVSRVLAAQGHEVVAVTRQQQKPPELPGVRFVRADLLDRASLTSCLASAPVDVVCHLAARTGGSASVGAADEYRSVNVVGLRNLLAAMGRSPGRRPGLVLASSSAVYRHRTSGYIAEDSPLRPSNPYGESKLAGERLAADYATSAGVGVTILRCFQVGGAGSGVWDSRGRGLLVRALRVAAGSRERIELVGRGLAVLDYVHVDDVAEAFLRAAEEVCAGEVRIYNVGSGCGTVVNDLLEVVRRITCRAVPVTRLSSTDPPQVIVADTRRISGGLGWKSPRSAIENIVSDAWNAMVNP